MMGWLVALLILFLLAILPLGASVLYDEDGPRVRILAGPVKIQVFPMKKAQKDKPKKEAKKKPAPKDKGAKKPAPKPKSGGSWTDFLRTFGLSSLEELPEIERVNFGEVVAAETEQKEGA